MNMKLLLSKSGYQLNSQTNVWVRPDYHGIAYSDGDAVEQRIAAIIDQAKDLSVLSTELRQRCTDWPSTYHLISTRANILRPFEPDLRGNILEIGAGCGAITRYLGECGCNVLAIEGSPRRAAIARARTRDLPNVTVVTDKFDNFRCDEKFDIVTMVGVLEYANLFTISENPPLSMLQRARSFLKPNGKLIIAIENQLGLKYFSGAPEDHVGQPMYGIEGRYRKDQPQTYGRKVLSEMLKNAGFAYSEFMAPFPDYKLPSSIITERGFSEDGFDAGALVCQSVKRDPQLPPILAFSPDLAWPNILQNGLALDLTNSFLIVAGNSQYLDQNILAWHFSTDRAKEFCKEAKFLLTDNGKIEVQYRLLEPNLNNRNKEKLLKFFIPERAEYIYGKPLLQYLIQIVTQDGWRIEEVGAFLKRYLTILYSFDSSGNIPLHIKSAENRLPGDFLDIIPQNIIISHNDEFYVIDKEWALNDEIPIGYLVFRSLLSLFHTVTRFGAAASDIVMTPLGFIHAAFNAIGFTVSESVIESYAKLEAAFQSEVAQRSFSIDGFLKWLSTASLPRQNLNQAVAVRDAQIARLSQAVKERDALIARLSQAVKERDALIARLSQAIAEGDRTG